MIVIQAEILHLTIRVKRVVLLLLGLSTVFGHWNEVSKLNSNLSGESARIKKPVAAKLLIFTFYNTEYGGSHSLLSPGIIQTTGFRAKRGRLACSVPSEDLVVLFAGIIRSENIPAQTWQRSWRCRCLSLRFRICRVARVDWNISSLLPEILYICRLSSPMPSSKEHLVPLCRQLPQ